jgi:hypothetical protein
LFRRSDSAAYRVAGSAQDKVCQSRSPPRIHQHANRQRLFASVHARSTRSPGHVESIIDHDACLALCRSALAHSNCRPRKIYQVSSRQIFLSDLNPIDSRTHSTFEALRQGRFAVLARLQVQGLPVSYITDKKCIGFFQRSRARVLHCRGLPPQHSSSDDDIERAQPSDHAAHGWMQQEGPKAGIVTQEVVSVPQAEPRHEQEDNSHLE